MSTYPALLLASTLTKALDTFLDPTFSGIHQLDWFDWALMIPYFSVLIILSAFGLHRYEMIRGYLKHKKKLTDGPASRFEKLPRVTIQLPLYNEKFVVERLLEETLKMRYPRELFQVQVLDDSTERISSRNHCAHITKLWVIRWSTGTDRTGMGIRPALCRKAYRPPQANSLPCSTPTLFRRKISWSVQSTISAIQMSE
jgi:hypothetical protein